MEALTTVKKEHTFAPTDRFTVAWAHFPTYDDRKDFAQLCMYTHTNIHTYPQNELGLFHKQRKAVLCSKWKPQKRFQKYPWNLIFLSIFRLETSEGLLEGTIPFVRPWVRRQDFWQTPNSRPMACILAEGSNRYSDRRPLTLCGPNVQTPSYSNTIKVIIQLFGVIANSYSMLCLSSQH